VGAENLLLRMQLALYQERQARPRRPGEATRATLALLARLIDWRLCLGGEDSRRRTLETESNEIDRDSKSRGCKHPGSWCALHDSSMLAPSGARDGLNWIRRGVPIPTKLGWCALHDSNVRPPGS